MELKTPAQETEAKISALMEHEVRGPESVLAAIAELLCRQQYQIDRLRAQVETLRTYNRERGQW